MARLGLGFRGDGQKILVALARDVVDLNFDLLLLGPLIDEIGRGFVRTGYPVISETHRELAGRMSGSNIGRCNQRRGRQGGSGYELSASELSA